MQQRECKILPNAGFSTIIHALMRSLIASALATTIVCAYNAGSGYTVSSVRATLSSTLAVLCDVHFNVCEASSALLAHLSCGLQCSTLIDVVQDHIHPASSPVSHLLISSNRHSPMLRAKSFSCCTSLSGRRWISSYFTHPSLLRCSP